MHRNLHRTLPFVISFSLCIADRIPLPGEIDVIDPRGICPERNLIAHHGAFHDAHFYTQHAELSVVVSSSAGPPKLREEYFVTFYLPAIPPFARRLSTEYIDTQYNRGEVNWGYTAQYAEDYTKRLLYLLELERTEEHEGFTNCVYRSVLENFFINGYLHIEKPTE